MGVDVLNQTFKLGRYATRPMGKQEKQRPNHDPQALVQQCEIRPWGAHANANLPKFDITLSPQHN